VEGGILPPGKNARIFREPARFQTTMKFASRIPSGWKPATTQF
jgi:hypothetical protein